MDTGETLHIITDTGKDDKLIYFDDKFQLEKHYIELVDRTIVSGVALRRGDTEVCLIDNMGQQVFVYFLKAKSDTVKATE